ncbi:unnamed protein product [Rotaria magnacalcarata]|uniref:Uncharacterized protein n=1 Tax=Rotaria magnacalcarata TaxID=392030 RepID=A0A816NFS7_9BILA|nr:unnamed protein product [Rotaria magnacalcarata]CAF2043080.1 unnamed protein product [Rotaria magnacalcarata]CAF2193296.1 unnamed protein product [Rotaria magnacalcarata]
MKTYANTIPSFYSWVVGLDLFGDGMGYPYCPFVAWPFIQYINDIREKKNENFGLRIQCGENVPFADADVGAYRHFIAHMYIVFRCLRFLQRKLKYGIRVGHGIAFGGILGDSNYQQTIRLDPLDPLVQLGVPIIFSTDDDGDGIWPIDHCPSKHPGHHSLVVEYCRAFYSSLIVETTDLETILKNTKNYCLSRVSTDYRPFIHADKTTVLPEDDKCASAIVFHPHVIKTMMQQYYKAIDESRACNENSCKISSKEMNLYKSPKFYNKCDIFARFIIYSHYYDQPESIFDYCQEYNTIFNDKPSADDIKYYWNNVWTELMNPTSKEKGHSVTIYDQDRVILSECNDDDKEHLVCLSEQLESHHHEPLSIRVFARRVTQPTTIKNFDEKHAAQSKKRKFPDNQGRPVEIFTTMDKDKYKDFEYKSIQFHINRNPTKRTNFFNKKEEHLLYAICPSASAATAYLHHICNYYTPSNSITSDQHRLETFVENYNRDSGPDDTKGQQPESRE